jgi:Fur family transcriptional regulator, ferric uptake regulator
MRTTRQRTLLSELVSKQQHAFTAEELWTAARESGGPVGLATVYRTLALLSEHGVVDEFAHHPGETCYRVCGEGHHHHLVCERCHGVSELEDCEVDGWLGKAAGEHGFLPTSHTLEVVGICAACQAA